MLSWRQAHLLPSMPPHKLYRRRREAAFSYDHGRRESLHPGSSAYVMESTNTLATPNPNDVPPRGKRPFGVYVIAVLQALNAFSTGARFLGVIDAPQLGVLNTTASDGLAALLMVVGLVVAAGLVMLKRWAWVATMLWVGVTLASELSLFFSGEDTNYLTLAISVAQVFYLNLSDVQRACARREPEIEAGLD